MKHIDWKVAGAAGLAAGLTVGGFSFVSASSVERAVRTVEIREGQAAPRTDPMLLVLSRATAAPAHALDSVSGDQPEVVAPSVVSATPKPTPKATTKVTTKVQSHDSVASVASVATVASVASAASVASVASAASAASVDSGD